MALNQEELLLQVGILADKTSDNPNMVYKSNGTLNKGLNPQYFTSNNTKIVNAINLLAKQSEDAKNQSITTSNNVSTMLGSLDSTSGLEAWNGLLELIKSVDPNYNTAIDALVGILKGKAIGEILQITGDDKGKVLSVATDDVSGDVILKAVDSMSGGATPTATDVTYTNENKPELNNVSLAIDFILSNLNEGPIKAEDISYTNPDKEEIVNLQLAIDDIYGMVGNINANDIFYHNESNLELSNVSGAIDYVIEMLNNKGVVSWDDITEKPDIVDGMELTETELRLRAGESLVSAIQIINDEDLQNIVTDLEPPVE